MNGQQQIFRPAFRRIGRGIKLNPGVLSLGLGIAALLPQPAADACLRDDPGCREPWRVARRRRWPERAPAQSTTSPREKGERAAERWEPG